MVPWNNTYVNKMFYGVVCLKLSKEIILLIGEIMNTQLSKKLGLRIRELRIAKGYKQAVLADLLNMERSNLTRIENGKQRPNDENIVKLAQILNVEVKDLFDFDHFDEKSVLISKITNFINDAEAPDLEFIYKTITNLESYKQNKKN